MRQEMGEDFDLKFAPEFGQAEESEDEYQDDPAYETSDDDYESDGEEYEEDEDDDGGEQAPDPDDDSDEYEDEEEPEEAIPLSRYNELRKAFTQKAMELSDLKKTLVPQTQQEAPAEKPKGVLAKSLEDIVEAKVNTKLESILAPIREQEAELEVQQAILELAENDPHFSEVSPMFLAQLEENPDLFEIENGLKIAYKAAKSEYLERVSVARAKAQKQEAVQRKQMKENVSDGASYTRPAPKARSEADFIKESIMGLGVRKPL